MSSIEHGGALRIRVMQPSDLDFAAACTAGVGWLGDNRPVLEDFHLRDPAGCFIAELGCQQAGICVATHYGDSGFVGELIVVEEMRGRGIGRQLLERAVVYLRSIDVQNVLLDAVPAAVPLYERMGFRQVSRSLRFFGRVQGRKHSTVRNMQSEDLSAVAALDHEAFGGDRSFFLVRRLERRPELCKVLTRDGEVAGFLMARPAGAALALGPWVVSPGVESPGQLVESLAAEVGERPMLLGVLETNGGAVAVAQALGFVERDQHACRMVLGPSAHLGSSRFCLAVASGAKG